jgi:transcriptional regulator with XRE-family HTH domain
MEKTKPAREFSELSALASRLAVDADWDLEELRAELRDRGVDPDRLVRNVVGMVEQWKEVNAGADISHTISSPVPSNLPLVNHLRRSTGMSTTEIAKEMGVTVTFLSLLERHAESLPHAWRAELADRAEQMLGVPREAVISAFDYRSHLRLAALEDSSRQTEAFDYEEVLAQSGMDEPVKQVWRALARGAK